MRPEAHGIRLPELPAMVWLDGAPPAPETLRQHAVLIEFWDATCLPCLRSLPWTRSWHRRYGASGLVVLGIHTPEFAFGRDQERLRAFAAERNLDYAIALDPDRDAWETFHNRYWPSRYLFDAERRLRYYHYGEGDEAECEEAIRELLEELDPRPTLPLPVKIVSQEVVGEGQAEIYLGLDRSHLGNAEVAVAAEASTWHLPGRREPGQPYLEGVWRPELRYLETVEAQPASLHARVRATAVHALLAPAGADEVALEVLLGGEPVPAGVRGVDLVETASGRTVVTVGGPRLFALVRDGAPREWDLQLRAESPGLRAYTLAFERAPAPAPPN